ncbi:MAG: DNA-processing protein DprA [Magnetococcus sp. DMHC-6]
MKKMNRRQLIDWLGIVRIPGFGPVLLNRLIDGLGSVEAVLSVSEAELRDVSGVPLPLLNAILEIRHRHHPVRLAMALELDRLTAMGGRVLIPGDGEYPAILGSLYDPPAALFVLGDPQYLAADDKIAVVGSRRASPAGCQMARKMAAQLASHGLITVSGLALGIDTAAHQGALDAQGATVAVVATGLDIEYPKGQGELRQRIVERGCVLTEAFLGTEPAPYLFPVRNRLLSGLSRGVVVVEATLQSGSLVTARCALEQGREVFAVPGPISDPRSQGVHQLLKQGACLVECVEDILTALHFSLRPLPVSDTLSPSVAGAKSNVIAEILAILTHGPLQADEIARSCQLTAGELSSILLQLELVGAIRRQSGNWISLDGSEK